MKHVFLLLLVVICLMFMGGSCDKPTPPEPPPADTVKTWTWKIDTLTYDGPSRPPDQINILSIWGSSTHDVWAVGSSDDILGELWHYSGSKWKVVTNWSYNGIDSGGSYLNDVYAVTGFDSANVFLFGGHNYDTTGTDIVLKWNGSVWTVVP